MHIRRLKFRFSLSEEDLRGIREAIRAWGKPRDVLDRYNGASLYNHFEIWEQFVSQEWSGWDISEYHHDIGVRTWIQVAIEHSTATTRADLERAVKPLDDKFKGRMVPLSSTTRYETSVLSEGPYFWEQHTIYPER